jgi:CheY-like chemotaxis protein
MKSDPQLAGTSVILMASQHRPLDEARASEVGADGHILKPFDTQDAINKATELAGQDEAFYDAPSIPVARSATAPPTARPATTPPSPVAQPSYRPTPPPLPLNGPSSRPMAPTPMSTGTPLTGAHVAVASTYPSQPVAAVVASTPMQTQATAAVDEALSHSVVERLETLGLTPDQVEGVLKLSAEVVERVVWEVVPELAEAMIREELHRLVGD